jgi:DNA polymerase beta
MDQSNNLTIIIMFEKLIDKLNIEYTQKIGKQKNTLNFKIFNIKKGLEEIKKYPTKIKNGNELSSIKGIGKGIISRIDEIINTGTLSELFNNINTPEINMEINQINNLISISGVGEVHAKKYIKQGILSVDDLREKWLNGKIKLTHHIEIGLKYYKEFNEKIPYLEICNIKLHIKQYIKQIYHNIILKVCGSHRRKKDFSSDIDILISSPDIKSDNDLISSNHLKNIIQVLKKKNIIIDDLTKCGNTKYMGVCIDPVYKIARRIDIRVVTYDSFYPALIYFTGSMEFNKSMRTIAIKKGYTLNEYGLYPLTNKNTKICITSEKNLFDILEMNYIKPVHRNM